LKRFQKHQRESGHIYSLSRGSLLLRPIITVPSLLASNALFAQVYTPSDIYVIMLLLSLAATGPIFILELIFRHEIILLCNFLRYPEKETVFRAHHRKYVKKYEKKSCEGQLG